LKSVLIRVVDKPGGGDAWARFLVAMFGRGL
jgi:hypothetical protein